MLTSFARPAGPAGPALLSLWLIVWLTGCSEPMPPLSAPDSPATRVIALAPHLTELTFSAMAGEQLVGVVAFSDYPPAARDITLIGDAFRLDYEVIH